MSLFLADNGYDAEAAQLQVFEMTFHD